MQKIIFPCVKGFGDAIISCTFARTLQDFKAIFLVSGKNLDIVSRLRSSNSEIHEIPGVPGPLAIYNLRERPFRSFLDSLIYRRELARVSGSDTSVFIDIPSIRNRLLHFGLPTFHFKLELPIYDGFEEHFKRRVLSDCVAPPSGAKRVAIFPFGSSRTRWLDSSTISGLISELQSRGISPSVCLHSSELSRLPDLGRPNSIYTNFYEMESLLDGFDAVVTVDSAPLHLSIFKEKKVFVLTNSHKLFIPGSLFSSKSVFALNPNPSEICELAGSIENFLDYSRRNIHV